MPLNRRSQVRAKDRRLGGDIRHSTQTQQITTHTMITGFDKETAPLTDYEQTKLLPVMVRSLAVKRGREKAVTNSYICDRLRTLGYDVNGARIRKLINHIRIKGLVPRLIATSDGYYVATDNGELADYIDSLKGREDAIRAVREAMERQAGILI